MIITKYKITIEGTRGSGKTTILQSIMNNLISNSLFKAVECKIDTSSCKEDSEVLLVEVIKK